MIYTFFFFSTTIHFSLKITPRKNIFHPWIFSTPGYIFFHPWIKKRFWGLGLFFFVGGWGVPPPEMKKRENKNVKKTKKQTQTQKPFFYPGVEKIYPGVENIQGCKIFFFGGVFFQHYFHFSDNKTTKNTPEYPQNFQKKKKR